LFKFAACSALMLGWGTAAGAQTALDRVDPSRVEERTRPDAKITDRDALPETPGPRVQLSGVGAVSVGAIALSGLQVLRPADFADIFERHIGRTLSSAELAGLVDAIAERARSRGFVFATAIIMPQPLRAGVLRIAVDEGAIDEVRLSGTENAAVRDALSPLIGGGPVTMAQLERRLLIAGDVDGLWIRRTRFLREGSRNVLAVELGADRITGAIGLTNDGSRPIGPVQADGLLKISQILGSADLLALSAVVTPFRPGEFGYGRIRYASRVGVDGTELFVALSYSQTHPGAYLRRRDIEGESWTATLGVFRPLWRRRTESLWIEGSIGVRTVEQDRAGFRARFDRLTVARVRSSGFASIGGGRVRFNATVSQGLDLLDATRSGDPVASRRDGDGVFTSFAFWTAWTGSLFKKVSMELAVAGQLATRPLLVSEEVGLGGGQFLRGYDYSERSGDQGAMASGELRYDVKPRLGPLVKPQLYGFVDGGRVTNLRGGFGTGTLVSTGAGLRATVAGSYTADVGIAVPLSGNRYDSGDESPVINFALSKRF